MKARTGIVVVVALAAWLGQSLALGAEAKPNPVEQGVTEGALRIVTQEGGVVECPLKHTDVQATISGFIARVKVTQTFVNPTDEKIEAVYVFPLPHKAAVDDMTMVIGERRIVGLIKRRAEARQVYEEAIARGATAALLEQERPNIFTQSVGNIPPRQGVRIEISYVDVLEYDMGVYEFHFPMVVGPRYIPGSPTSKIPTAPPELKGKVGELGKVPVGGAPPKGTGWSPDTNRVPDASRITPPVLKPGFRNGHDVSLSVRLDAGVPIQDLKVANHKAAVERDGKSKAAIALTPEDNIPNKDFVLRYGVVGKKPEMAVLCHVGEMGHGYFMLMVQPQEDERLKLSPPREIVFLVDVSGSMSGGPIAKVREAMAKLLKLCRPQDTLQVITFASQSYKLFPKAVSATEENTRAAVNFTENMRGGGGTEMLKGVQMAINDPLDPERLRIVIMLTDGYIGNEAEIIAEVGRRCGDHIRFWCIGIGSSPNRFLVDGVGQQGGGASKVLGLRDDPEPMAVEVMNRIQRAQLSNVVIDWGGANVWETYPAKIPELWAGRPIILFGRFEGANQETQILIKGEVEGKPTSWTLPVRFPVVAPDNAVLSTIWARNKIEDLMQETYYQGSPEVEDEVTRIALNYRLMSQYTSFVAVDESEVKNLTAPARPPRRMLVPVPIPEGTRFEGFFGAETEKVLAEARPSAGPAPELIVPYEPSPRRWSRALPPPMAVGTPRPTFGVADSYGPGIYSGGIHRGPAFAPTLDARLKARGATYHSFIGGGGGAARAHYTLAYRNGRIVVPAGGTLSLARVHHTYDYATNEEDLPVAELGEQVIRPQMRHARELAERALKDGEALRGKGQSEAVRATFAWAYLLGEVANPEVAAKAQEDIEGIDKELQKAWAKALPGLEKRLDLVLRDRSLAEALDALRTASGLTIRLLPGSIEDATALNAGEEPRVTYLDLRRATVAQALTWLLVPARMDWWVADGTVVLGTARRLPNWIAAPWVHDVSALALPTAKELEAAKDRSGKLKLIQKASEEFLKATRAALSVKEDAAVWYGAGQLLVFGDAKAHAAAAKLFSDLADPAAKLEGGLAALQKITAPRARGHEAARAKLASARARAEVSDALESHVWPLLAAAAAGEVDLESLTELQVALRNPAVADLSKAGSAVLLRAAWAIGEAARALPKDAELAALAKSAREAARPAADAALAALEKPQANPQAFFGVAYAVLAFREDAACVANAREALAKAIEGRPDSGSLLLAWHALLLPPSEADRGRLADLVAKTPQQVVGEDSVVWTALACRRAGGDAWRAFRANARDLLGGQPLDGGVVILVNRLSNPASPLVAGAR